MSEEADKVFGIRQLAIFPLPLVLVPFELLPLHIFEPRYREMLRDVQSDMNVFGISSSESGGKQVELPPVGSIGCAAEIQEARTLDDGRSNILTSGVIRFRIDRYVETDKPYLIAEIDFFEDESEKPSSDLTDTAFSLFKQVASLADKIGGGSGVLPEIEPAPPERLSFMIAASLNLTPSVKYELIETRSTSKRFELLNDVLKTTVARMEDTVRINKISRTNGHSNKKIDFGGL